MGKSLHEASRRLVLQGRGRTACCLGGGKKGSQKRNVRSSKKGEGPNGRDLIKSRPRGSGRRKSDAAGPHSDIYLREKGWKVRSTLGGKRPKQAARGLEFAAAIFRHDRR